MASSTETSINNIKIHQVPTYNLWLQQYGQTNGIGINDLVILPPDQLQPALPSQSGHSGHFLTTNGTSLSWVSGGILPSQSGNSGKFLTTNGSVASWAIISTPIASTTSPKQNGTATVGTENAWARGDHIHPTDTTRMAANLLNVANGVAGLNSQLKVKPEQTSSTIISITSTTTLNLTHAGCLLETFNAGSNTINITIPNSNAVNFPIGTEIEILRWGSGPVYIKASSGVTVNGTTGSSVNTSINAQYGSICLKKLDTNIWNLQGAF